MASSSAHIRGFRFHHWGPVSVSIILIELTVEYSMILKVNLLNRNFCKGSGESETLPISQEELAQLMAQSLATSGNYGRQPARHQPKPKQPQEDFEGDEDDDEKEGPEAPEAPQPNPQEYNNNDGGHEDGGEGSQYGQQEGHSEGHSEGDSGDSNYDQGPQSHHQDSGYHNSGPNYQQEGEHYQNPGQYPESQGEYSGVNDDDRQEHQEQGGHQHEHQPGHRQAQHYDQGYGYRPQGESDESEYKSSAQSGAPGFGMPTDYSYASPGSGYAGPGSESFVSYSVRSAPKIIRFQS